MPTSRITRLEELQILGWPVAVFVLGNALLFYLGSYNVIVKGIDNPSMVYEASNRYVFLGSYLLFICVSVFIIIFSARNSWKYLSFANRIKVLTISVGFVVILSGIFYKRISSDERFYYLLGEENFQFSMRIVSGWNGINIETAWLILKILTFIALPLGIFATLCLVLGTVAALAQPKAQETSYTHQLSIGVDLVNRYLYLSGAFMVCSMVLLISWMQWSSFSVANRSEYHELVRGLSTYFGVWFTLLIFSYYVPASLKLNKRIYDLAFRQVSEQNSDFTENDIRIWRASKGLDVYEFASYQNVVALFSPLIAGIAGSILSIIGDKAGQ